MKKDLKGHNPVALDTNIFSYYFHKHPEFGEISKKLISRLLESNTKIITSNITLAELLSLNAPSSLLKNLKKEILAFPLLEIIEVSNDIAIKAGGIRREYSLKLPDAIQLATAIQSNAKAFITNDQRLKKFKQIKIVLITEIT